MSKLGKYADFFIRAVMLLTTFLLLMFFSTIYNLTLFVVIGLLYLVAIIIKGVEDFKKSKE